VPAHFVETKQHAAVAGQLAAPHQPAFALGDGLRVFGVQLMSIQAQPQRLVRLNGAHKHQQ